MFYNRNDQGIAGNYICYNLKSSIISGKIGYFPVLEKSHGQFKEINLTYIKLSMDPELFQSSLRNKVESSGGN